MATELDPNSVVRFVKLPADDLTVILRNGQEGIITIDGRSSGGTIKKPGFHDLSSLAAQGTIEVLLFNRGVIHGNWGAGPLSVIDENVGPDNVSINGDFRWKIISPTRFYEQMGEQRHQITKMTVNSELKAIITPHFTDLVLNRAPAFFELMRKKTKFANEVRARVNMEQLKEQFGIQLVHLTLNPHFSPTVQKALEERGARGIRSMELDTKPLRPHTRSPLYEDEALPELTPEQLRPAPALEELDFSKPAPTVKMRTKSLKAAEKVIARLRKGMTKAKSLRLQLGTYNEKRFQDKIDAIERNMNAVKSRPDAQSQADLTASMEKGTRLLEDFITAQKFGKKLVGVGVGAGALAAASAAIIAALAATATGALILVRLLKRYKRPASLKLQLFMSQLRRKGWAPGKALTKDQMRALRLEIGGLSKREQKLVNNMANQAKSATKAKNKKAATKNKLQELRIAQKKVQLYKVRQRQIEKSGSSDAYKALVKKKLKEYGVKSPAELKGAKKKKFFDELDASWKGKNEND